MQRYSDAYLTCRTAPCTRRERQVIDAGNRLPGTPKSNAYASVRWGSELGWSVNANAQYVSDIAVSDLNEVFAPSYAVFGLGGGWAADLPNYRLNMRSSGSTTCSTSVTSAR